MHQADASKKSNVAFVLSIDTRENNRPNVKICFIWTERFRNFRNFGLNLSSVEKFSYQNGTLYINTLVPLPNDFFGPEMSEVTGIVGKNGAGKSNALELICHAIKGGKSSLAGDFFVVTYENGTYICHYSFASGRPPEVPLEVRSREYEPTFCPMKVVFFSNVYDDRRMSFHRDVSDISLNSSVRRPLTARSRETDFAKQIRLVNSKVFKDLEIELPEKVQLLSKLWSPRVTFRIENASSVTSFKMKQFRTNFRDRVRDISSGNKFPMLFKFGYFFEMYILYQKQAQSSEKGRSRFLKGLERLFDELNEIRSTDEISERLIDYLVETFDAPEFKPSENQSAVKNREGTIGLIAFNEQINFIRQLKELIGNLRFDYYSEGLRARNIEYFTFDYRSKGAKKFISDFTTLFGRAELFDIDWMGISSGHKAYLNIFASLHQELKTTKQGGLILCIDEGDLYLHPQWQVEFFDKLINALPNLFSGKVQLVLTSHSPFLLSDLPRQNITILDPEVVGYSMNGVDLSSNTFGGNLYDLYAEPFFLGRKKTSDFAYKKIREVIEKVEAGKLTKSERSNLLEQISIFGDEIIQFRLREILKK